MEITKEFFERHLKSGNLRKSHLADFDCIDHGIKIIKTSEVIKDSVGNQIRVNDNYTDRVKEQNRSHDNGFDLDCNVPVVRVKTNGKYELADGFGRSEFIFNQEYYAFQVIEVENQDEYKRIRVYFNREIPKVNNTQNDLVEYINDRIRNGYISKNYKSVEKSLREVEPNISIKKTKEIWSKVKQTDIEAPKNRFIKYNANAVRGDWMKNHWNEVNMSNGGIKNEVKEDKEYGYKYSINQKKALGLCLGQTGSMVTYIERELGTASNRFNQYGLHTELLFSFTDSIGDQGWLLKERKKTINKFNEIISNLELASKGDFHYLTIKGFVPQDTENEDMKSVYTLEQLKIDSEKIKCEEFDLIREE